MMDILNEVKQLVNTCKPDGIPTKIKHNQKIYQTVLEYTTGFGCNKISEKIFCYVNQLPNKPICKCGNECTFFHLTFFRRKT